MIASNDTLLIGRLTQDLGSCRHLPKAAQWVRLKGGRTNHVWQVTGTETDRPVIVKLYDLTIDNPLFPNRPKDEALVLQALEGLGMAPRLLHHGTTSLGDCLIYSHLEGRTWRDDPARVAALLHKLHRVTPPKGLPRAPDGSAELAHQIAGILSRCTTANLKDLPSLPTQTVTPSGAACLLHGDPVPGNLIESNAALHLIDWQCPSVGDPCEDIALFLSPAMQIAYRGAPLSASEKQDFLAAYPAPKILARYGALAPWYHARSFAYCLWQADQGDETAVIRAKAERAALEGLGLTL